MLFLNYVNIVKILIGYCSFLGKSINLQTVNVTQI